MESMYKEQTGNPFAKVDKVSTEKTISHLEKKVEKLSELNATLHNVMKHVLKE